MAYSIRGAVSSDIPWLYDICVRTSEHGADASSMFRDPRMPGLYFAAPYYFYDKSLCFIAQLDDEPQGYLVATEKSIEYTEWLLSEWLPPIRKLYPLSLLDDPATSTQEKNSIFFIHKDALPLPAEEKKRFTEYPAHLHMNLLPALRGMGCGKALLANCFAELKKRDCPGIHLAVSRKNPSAESFYRKNGFRTLEEHSWGRFLALTQI